MKRWLVDWLIRRYVGEPLTQAELDTEIAAGFATWPDRDD